MEETINQNRAAGKNSGAKSRRRWIAAAAVLIAAAVACVLWISRKPAAAEPDLGAELREVLQQHDITEDLVPSWFPEGFTQTELQAVNQPFQRTFMALYQKEDACIAIQLNDYNPSNPAIAEKNGEPPEVYSSGNRVYYILRNNAQLQIVWNTDDMEGRIWGNITREEAHRMIDSIEKG